MAQTQLTNLTKGKPKYHLKAHWETPEPRW